MKTHTCTSPLSFANLTKEYGEWLNKSQWDYFCTFTTSYRLSRNQAYNTMQRLFSFTSHSTAEVKIFWIAEKFKAGGYHIHALVYTNSRI